MAQRERKARQKWQGLVSAQGRSGQSVAAFCRERQLCPSHFFGWKKRLRAAEPGAVRTRLRKFVEVKLSRAVELRASELAMILDGIDVSRLVRGPRYERPAEETALGV